MQTLDDHEDAPPPVPQLLDVLDRLPPDDLHRGFWSPLERDDDAQGHFKLLCRQSLHLADALIATQHLALKDESPCPHSADAQAARGPRSAPLRAQTMLLQRLPHLRALSVHGGPHEVGLVAALSVFGDATEKRLTSLMVSCHQLTPGICRTVRAACPQLLDLHLQPPCGFAGGEGWAAQASLFQPMYGSGLTKLVVSANVNVAQYLHLKTAHSQLDVGAGGVLSSLCSLTSLRHLELDMPGIQAAHLPPFTALLSLRHLHLFSIGGAISLADAAPLFSSTHLTHLDFADVSHTAAHSGASAGKVASALARLSAPWHAFLRPGKPACAAPHLAALTNLTYLCLGLNCMVDDTVFAALHLLIRLTGLCVGSIHLTHASPGHLPALQRLQLDTSRPTQLLQALLPLLPLSALECLAASVLIVEEDGNSGVARSAGRGPTARAVKAAEEAAALRNVAHHLLAAPRLKDTTLELLEEDGEVSYAPLGDVAAGLLPDAARSVSERIERRFKEREAAIDAKLNF